MKICYVNPTNNIRRPIAELSEILAKEGYQVSIMFPLSADCPTKNWVANDRIEKNQITRLPVKSWYFSSLRYSFPNLVHLWKTTQKIFKENDRVHIWEYYYPISVFPLLYALFTGNRKKVILTTDGFVGYSYKPKKPRWLTPAFKLYTQLFARFLFKIPQKMTTYGKVLIPHARKAGVPIHKLQVLPTGIHLTRFQNISEEKVGALKKEFNINDEKIIFYAGMLTERKGIDKIINISTQLLDEGMNIKTLLVGDAHGENTFQKLVPEKYKDKIIFTGGRKDIPEFMKLSHVLLLPSEGEGLPGVVMEAMAAGLPVVATDEGCTPDLIESGKEGYLAQRENTDEYREAVKRIIKEKKTIESRNKISQFSWQEIKKQYLSLYGEAR
ncbi:glycosyltransferase family 4 protein [Candidatus Woesearchaeota archaeon]|nr:glycosyltransferase family 4 protein [Candidatus Woesearchaeota archaeon]